MTNPLTIEAVYNAIEAIGKPAIFLDSTNSFANGELPSTQGTVEILFLSTARAHINFYGKGDNIGDYRMYLGRTGNNNAPSGVWKRVGNTFVVTTPQISLTTNGSSKSWSITEEKPGYTPLSATFYHGYSTEIMASPEVITLTDGEVFLQGFARRTTNSNDLTTWYAAKILWVKN